MYVQRVNPVRTPKIIDGFWDIDHDEAAIKSLLASVTGTSPFDELVDEIEQRNRLNL